MFSASWSEIFHVSLAEIGCLTGIIMIIPLIYVLVKMGAKKYKVEPLGTYLSKDKDSPHVD